MKRITFYTLLSLIMMWIPLMSYAQKDSTKTKEEKYTKIDMKDIEKKITDKSSNFYYPKIFDRYLKGDTTLTLEEKRCVYYGYSFQKEYDPYGGDVSNDEKLQELFAKDSLTEKEENKAIDCLYKSLKEDPFLVRRMSTLMYFLKKKNRLEEKNAILNRGTIVLDALMSTGDGISKENAIKVININQEYDVINFVLELDIKNIESQKLLYKDGCPYDYLKIKSDEYDIEGLYFDISICMKHLSNIFDK
jgi:hypothetical protein